MTPTQIEIIRRLDKMPEDAQKVVLAEIISYIRGREDERNAS